MTTDYLEARLAAEFQRTAAPPDAPPEAPMLTDQEAYAELERYADLYEKIRRVKHNQKSVLTRLTEKLAFYDQTLVPVLRRWAEGKRMAMLEAGRKPPQTLNYTIACCQFRRQPEKVQVTDPVAALAWAREHCPAALTVDAAKIPIDTLEVVDPETGERSYTLPPGLAIGGGGESFYVRPTPSKVKDEALGDAAGAAPELVAEDEE